MQRSMSQIFAADRIVFRRKSVICPPVPFPFPVTRRRSWPLDPRGIKGEDGDSIVPVISHQKSVKDTS